MAKRFLNSLRLVNLSSDPVSASAGDIYYNSSSNAIKLYNGSSWTEVGGDFVVDSGSSYPTTSLTNGQLFYNTVNGRTAIYFGSVWKEFAYLADINIDGGASSTVEFESNIDGGTSSTTVFVNSYDGGAS